jgi:hypothetical protein
MLYYKISQEIWEDRKPYMSACALPGQMAQDIGAAPSKSLPKVSQVS